MKIVRVQDYNKLSEYAADFVADEITKKGNLVLGLPTGDTPIGMYTNLCAKYQKGVISFSNVITFNLDEYLGLSRSHEQSYYFFMNNKLYSKVDLKQDNINIPDGSANNTKKECENYDKKIVALGGLDVMVLGIGKNGHIGFNEPNDFQIASTHVIRLTKDTIEANSRFFEQIEEVPKEAITMGLRGIFSAKKIILLASGENKKEAVKDLVNDVINPKNPATFLLLHKNLTVVVDQAAGGYIC